MPDEVVSTPFGKFLVNPEECIGATVKAGTVWDGAGFLQLLALEHGRLGEPGMTILDVGAHLGDWAIWLARKGAWRVVVVEPAPEMIAKLKANLDLNRDIADEHIALIPVAAYDRRTILGWTEPYVSRDSGGAALRVDVEGAIPAAPLDEYAFLWSQGVSLIKVDAQGCDGAALHGLQHTITRDHPCLIFEWEDRLAPLHGYTLADTLVWLSTLGYHTWEWPSHLHNYVAIWQGER